MNNSTRLITKVIAVILIFAVCGCLFCSCEKKKKSGKLVDSSMDTIYTKSDAVRREQSNNTYTIYGVAEKNADGTVNLKKYKANSLDYGRTINILSNSAEDVNSVTVDENTVFEIDKLKDDTTGNMTDLEVFMSKIGKRYNGKLIYFEMELTGNHADSVRFFKEYYR